MRILHLSSEKTWRGGEQQIAYLIDELIGHGHEVIVAVRKDSAFEKHCLKKNIPFISLAFRNSFDLITAVAINVVTKREHIDVIHLHSAKSHAIAVLSAVLGNKTPMLLSRRVDFIPKSNRLTRFKYNHPSIKRIACVSDKITSIMKAYVDRPEKCLTIHSGVDLHKFVTSTQGSSIRQQFNLPDDTFLIGNTSALEDHKDYFTFIDTINVLKQHNARVKAIIFGDGSLREILQHKVSTLGLSEDIIFAGFRNDLPQVLPQLNVFLMTSKEEGLGTSVLDAFAAKIPVVATAAGGIPEMVIDQVTGLLCPIKDTERLAVAIETLIAKPELRNVFVDNAFNKVKEFTKEKTALRTIDVYREIISSPTTGKHS